MIYESDLDTATIVVLLEAGYSAEAISEMTKFQP
jgi:hypothetical protein